MATSWRILLPPPDNEWGPLPPHATPRLARRWQWLERLLFVVGFALLGYYGYVTLEARLYQAFENRELDAILASAPRHAGESTATAADGRVSKRREPPLPGSVIGRIEIPRLGVSTVIRAGSDAKTLRLAVGHIPGTALPGDDGNIGLAGHRDTFFRRLRDIAPDDEIRVVTPEGTYRFRVQRTNVVWPRDTWVLDDAGEPVLTLVTCYPFTYVGSAPQRFIVRAVEFSGTAASL
jgi:sortase A